MQDFQLWANWDGRSPYRELHPCGVAPNQGPCPESLGHRWTGGRSQLAGELKESCLSGRRASEMTHLKRGEGSGQQGSIPFLAWVGLSEFSVSGDQAF